MDEKEQNIEDEESLQSSWSSELTPGQKVFLREHGGRTAADVGEDSHGRKFVFFANGHGGFYKFYLPKD